MEVKLVKIEDLKPSEYNPRKINDLEIEKLKSSIKRFGMVEPIVVNSNPDRYNNVIGGHQRLLAAKNLGIEEVPTVYVNLDEQHEKLLNLALNRISGEWDTEKLKEVFADLSIILENSQEIDLSGFDEYEIKKLFENSEALPELEDFNSESKNQVFKEELYFLKEEYEIFNEFLLNNKGKRREESIVKLMKDSLTTIHQ